jgi:hypothetical protein
MRAACKCVWRALESAEGPGIAGRPLARRRWMKARDVIACTQSTSTWQAAAANTASTHRNSPSASRHACKHRLARVARSLPTNSAAIHPGPQSCPHPLPAPHHHLHGQVALASSNGGIPARIRPAQPPLHRPIWSGELARARATPTSAPCAPREGRHQDQLRDSSSDGRARRPATTGIPEH